MPRPSRKPGRALEFLRQRGRKGITREELAQALGISESYVSKVVAHARELLPEWQTIEAEIETWKFVRWSRYRIVRDYTFPGPGQRELFEIKQEVA